MKFIIDIPDQDEKNLSENVPCNDEDIYQQGFKEGKEKGYQEACNNLKFCIKIFENGGCSVEFFNRLMQIFKN